MNFQTNSNTDKTIRKPLFWLDQLNSFSKPKMKTGPSKKNKVYG